MDLYKYSYSIRLSIGRGERRSGFVSLTGWPVSMCFLNFFNICTNFRELCHNSLHSNKYSEPYSNIPFIVTS
jgi:hypothetical protein